MSKTYYSKKSLLSILVLLIITIILTICFYFFSEVIFYLFLALSIIEIGLLLYFLYSRFTINEHGFFVCGHTKWRGRRIIKPVFISFSEIKSTKVFQHASNGKYVYDQSLLFVRLKDDSVTEFSLHSFLKKDQQEIITFIQDQLHKEK